MRCDVMSRHSNGVVCRYCCLNSGGCPMRNQLVGNISNEKYSRALSIGVLCARSLVQHRTVIAPKKPSVLILRSHFSKTKLSNSTYKWIHQLLHRNVYNNFVRVWNIITFLMWMFISLVSLSDTCRSIRSMMVSIIHGAWILECIPKI